MSEKRDGRETKDQKDEWRNDWRDERYEWSRESEGGYADEKESESKGIVFGFFGGREPWYRAAVCVGEVQHRRA